MLLMTEYTCKCLVGKSLGNPIDLLQEIYPAVYRYGQELTSRKNLRPTFALNAMVPVDMALWQLYSAENGLDSFDRLIPDSARPAMTYKQEELSLIPAVGYGMKVSDIVDLADAGAFLLKIKIGNDPEHDGDPQKMLHWDMARLSEIHAALKDRKSQYTESGSILYYLDANGRYDSRERLDCLLEYADKKGFLSRIAVLEEPFQEGADIDVIGLPILAAADESAHSNTDIEELIQKGYKSIALKPIAKTLSMSFLILAETLNDSISCFCADLTVNPLMSEWNKNMAARIAPMPGIKIGAFELNGPQNYINWNQMQTYHPFCEREWANAQDGIYRLSDDFYKNSGGIFAQAPHYTSVAKGV